MPDTYQLYCSMLLIIIMNTFDCQQLINPNLRTVQYFPLFHTYHYYLCVHLFCLMFSSRLVHRQDNFQQEAHPPILSYSLIQTFYWNELLRGHITSLRLLHCCLVSLILALNTREVFKKPALCIKHQVICAKQRAPVTTFNL